MCYQVCSTVFAWSSPFIYYILHAVWRVYFLSSKLEALLRLDRPQSTLNKLDLSSGVGVNFSESTQKREKISEYL